MTQTSGALWLGSHTHSPRAQCLSYLPPSLACPPALNAIPSLVGVFRDPAGTTSRHWPSVQARVVVPPMPESTGSWQWESWARHVLTATPHWAGREDRVGRQGELEGWEPGAPQVTHPQADNTQAGSGNPLVLTGETLAFPASCPRPCAMPVGGSLPPRGRSQPGSSSTGVAPHPSELVRQQGLGILFLTLPTAGKSDLQRRDEWGGGGQGSREEKNKVERRAGSWLVWPSLGLR